MTVSSPVSISSADNKRNNNSDSVNPNTQLAVGDEQSQNSQIRSSGRCRCIVCRARLGIMAFGCKCVQRESEVFCLKHRNPEDHGCSFDYMQEGKKRLEESLPVVSVDKVAHRL
jgi:hypothetical protein